MNMIEELTEEAAAAVLADLGYPRQGNATDDFLWEMGRNGSVGDDLRKLVAEIVRLANTESEGN